jgi:hypothetical protein
MAASLDRRDLLKLLSAAAFTTLQLPAAVPNAPLFFTKDQFAALDILTELIVPADEHSPGAHAAGVAAFIDRTVAESFLPEDKSSWQKGLASIDTLSQSMYQTPFLKTGRSQQIALLTKIAANERHAETDAEKFFTQLKQTTAFAYYSSSIGIHQDIQYKGNVALPQFVGYDAT